MYKEWLLHSLKGNEYQGTGIIYEFNNDSVFLPKIHVKCWSWLKLWKDQWHLYAKVMLFIMHNMSSVYVYSIRRKKECFVLMFHFIEVYNFQWTLMYQAGVLLTYYLIICKWVFLTPKQKTPKLILSACIHVIDHSSRELYQ